MSKFTISSVFNVVDKASTTIDKMTKKVDGLGAAAGKAQSVLGGIGKGVTVAAKGIAVVAGAAVAAGGAVFGMAMKASAAADSINDTAQSLGIATNALQEYRYIANLAGMSSDDMDKALTKLTVNLGKGGSEVDEALSSLGLTAEQLKKAGPDKVLELVADGMKGMTDPTRKAAVVTQLFGKSSVKMVNALSEGSEGMAALRKEAQETGYVLDEVAVKAGAEMGDAMDRLKMTAGGAFNRIGSVFLPMVTKAINGLTEFISKNRTMLDGLVSGLGGVFESIGPIMAKLGPLLIDSFNKLLPMFTKLLDAAMPVLNQIMDALTDIMPAVIQLADAIGKVLVPVFKLLKPLLDLILPVITRIITDIATIAGWIADIIAPILDLFAKAASLLGKKLPQTEPTGQGVPSGAMYVPLSGQTSTINKNTKSTVDVNFNNAPAGTSIKSSGQQAPGINLSLGMAGAR